jgi:hypothetical protein
VIARLLALQQRRVALVARSEQERAEVAAQFALLEPRLRAADRVISAVRAHPLAASAGTLALMFAGARTLLRWGLHVAPLYSLFRAAQRHLKAKAS